MRKKVSLDLKIIDNEYFPSYLRRKDPATLEINVTDHQKSNTELQYKKKRNIDSARAS